MSPPCRESIQVHPLPQSIQARNIPPPGHCHPGQRPWRPSRTPLPAGNPHLAGPLAVRVRGPLLAFRRGAATLARPLASTSGVVTGWPSGSGGQHHAPGRMLGVPGVPARTRLRVSPTSRALGMRESAGNSGEPLPCLGPLARVAPHLIFPRCWVGRPQARPAARFGLMPPPAFVWAPRRSQRAWGRISSTERCRLSATRFSVFALPMSISRGSSVSARP